MTLVSGLVALALLAVFREQALPPGGDPGNWLSTALAYIGRPYPTQVIPFAYAPLTFPFLGAAVIVAGPVNGVELFAVLLVIALGLSTAALATTLLRTRLMAFLAVVFLLADPALLGMFFWGAYPNILGFVWMNLALVGLLRAGQGHPSSGAAQFWACFLLAVLTHSLVGAVLAVTAAMYLGLGLFVPMPTWRTLVSRARRGSLEAPGLAARALFASRGGQGGIVAFIGLVGGYYGLCWWYGIPHPGYLSTDANGFGTTSLTGAFSALLPGTILPVPAVVGLLVVAAFGAALVYAVIRDRRPEWLTSSAVLLLAWPLAVTLLILGGFAARITTDYRRFGYFYLIPAGLGAAYLVERSWLLGPSPKPEETPTSSPTVAGHTPHRRPPPTTSGRRGAVSPARRATACGLIALVVLAVFLYAVTIPGVAREETTFTQVGHDAAFVQAVSAVRHAGMTGGVITVPGADKWVRGLTGENSFAPYATNALLFYPSQQYDSELTFYALSSHYAITNGHVTASVRGTAPSLAGGIPDYSVYFSGTPTELVRLSPSSVVVHLKDLAHAGNVTANLTTDPTVTLPSSLGGPLVITYVEPGFILNISTSIPGSSPSADIALTATARAPYALQQIDIAAVPPAGSTALTWPNLVPGSFLWSPAGDPGRPSTIGNVTPATAFRGATDYDPSTGSPAALMAFGAPSANGSTVIRGALNITTPSAEYTEGAQPGVFSTPAIWAYLGVRFVLWWNASASQAASVIPATEAGFLVLEYGLKTIYQNAEWVALEIPTTLVAPPAPGSAGAAAR